jgi:hypothetical protein
MRRRPRPSAAHGEYFRKKATIQNTLFGAKAALDRVPIECSLCILIGALNHGISFRY